MSGSLLVNTDVLDDLRKLPRRTQKLTSLCAADAFKRDSALQSTMARSRKRNFTAAEAVTQKRLFERAVKHAKLAVARDIVKGGKSVRTAASIAKVSKTQLQHVINGTIQLATEAVPVAAENSSSMAIAAPVRIGRPTRFSANEEHIIVEAVSEYARLGTLMSRSGLQDLAASLISAMPPAQRGSLGFKNDRPGVYWVDSFLQRHPNLSLRRRANLEFGRADAMTAENLATHFSGLAMTYKQYKITSADQVYNLDEIGFSVRSADRGRAKALGLADGRTNKCQRFEVQRKH
jgi:hypothetical protein